VVSVTWPKHVSKACCESYVHNALGSLHVYLHNKFDDALEQLLVRKLRYSCFAIYIVIDSLQKNVFAYTSFVAQLPSQKFNDTLLVCHVIDFLTHVRI